MKSVNIKNHPIHTYIRSLKNVTLIISLLASLAFLFISQPVLAAPSQCAVATFKGTVGPEDCSKITGIPDNVRALLTSPPANDKCYLLTYEFTNSASANTPKVEDKNCTSDLPFRTGKVERDTTLFNKCNTAEDNTDDCVNTYINTIINFLSAGVVVIVIIMVIIGGIRYSAAGGDAQKVAAAKQQIYNAIFALAAFIFLYAFLQLFVPGGWF